jgi:hypothetical protein
MEKSDKLVELLKRLNSGEDPARVRQEAKEFLTRLNPKDLSFAEQKLLNCGLSSEDLRQLCSIHMEVLQDELKKTRAELPPGHMIHTMESEHEMILGFLEELEKVNESIQKMDSYNSPEEGFHKLVHIAEHLVAAEPHHEREEEILFPELEKRGVWGPPRIMRMEHQELRPRKKVLKVLAEYVAQMDFSTFKKRLQELVEFIVPTLREHIFKENNILYPTALQLIEDEEIWTKMKVEADKVGYCCFTPSDEPEA